MERTTGSIHGHHTTFPSPGLPDFFTQAPFLLSQLSLAGLKNWVEYGIRNYRTHPERQKDYFTVQSADSRAVLQRERHGTLFMDVERKLDLYLRGLWQESEQLVPYSTAFDELRKPVPYYDKLGMRIPDVRRLRRARATVESVAPSPPAGEGSRASTATAPLWPTWSATGAGPRPRSPTTGARSSAWPSSSSRTAASKPCFAANIPACAASSWPCTRSPPRTPAIRKPPPACATAWPCCRAPCSTRTTATATPTCSTFVARFHALMAEGTSNTKEIAALALSYVAKTRRQSDQSPRSTSPIPWWTTATTTARCGNSSRKATRRRPSTPSASWSRARNSRACRRATTRSGTTRASPTGPDWVSVYEALHPKGNPADIDRLLEKHSALAKRLKRILDLLKPQDKIRIRYQEEGSELDLDVAIRSLIDFKGGANPDPRINMSHRTDGRNIAVMLLLDLSESLNEKASRFRADHPGTQPGSRLPAGLGGGTTGRPLRHRRLPLQHPPRRALPAHQGLWRTLGRRSQGPPGRHAGRLFHPHGRRHAPRRPLPGSAPGRQETDADPDRRPAQSTSTPTTNNC
jgi:nitric oxide reductase NorD protein